MIEERSKQINLFFLGIIVVCTLALAGAFLFGIVKTKKGSSIINQIQNKIEDIAQPTGQTYKEDVNKIMSEYFGKVANIINFDETEKTATWLTLAEQTKNQLLLLRVPTDFKDKHLEIILNIDKIENLLIDRNIEGAKVAENNLQNISKL